MRQKNPCIPPNKTYTYVTMSFVSSLYFGCTTTFNAPWPGAASGLPPPGAALAAFKKESIHLLSTRYESDRLQALIEVKDSVPPAFLIQRLKGRLSHALKQAYPSFPGFSRHFFLRTLGQNTKSIVSNYIQSQVDNSDLVDPLYRQRMKELRYQQAEQVLADKTRHQGIYDLFAHVGLVTGGRYRMFTPEARKVFDSLCAAAETIDATPMDISMMPDHAHLLLRWPKGLSAEELLEGVKQASGNRLRRSAFWHAGGYVGSVGPYPLKVAQLQNHSKGWSAS